MRTFILLFTITLFIMAGLFSANSTLLIFAVPFLLLFILGLVQTAENNITITRTLSTIQATVGSPVDVTLTIENNGPTISEFYLSDLLPDGLRPLDGEETTLAQPLKKGGSAVLQWRTEPKRGIWQLTQAHIKGCNLFGFSPFDDQIDVAGQTVLTVIAQPEDVGEIVIRPKQTRAFAGTIPARTAGSGSDFFGVRQYRPGDSLRHVNWRATARKEHGLFTNEFEEERVADVGLVIDARLGAVTCGGNQKLLEYELDAAAAFAESFLAAGNRVSLLVYGHILDWVLPGYGKFQRQRILTKLAGVQAGESQVFSTFNHLPIRLFPAKSQIVLFTPLLPDDVQTLIKIRARDYALMVVAPDAVAWEMSHLPDTKEREIGARIAQIERKLAVRTLNRAGIQVIEWNVDQPLEKLVRTRLRRPFGGI